MNKLKNIFVILLIGVLGLISSCDEPDPNPEHVHKFSNEWEYHDFSHYYRCECGTITSDEPHSFGEWVVVDEPTESAVGSKKHICDVCGYEGHEEIPTLQHTHEFYEEITEPTCTEEGCINYVCACGYFSDSQSIPATGHKEEVIEGYESTCSSFGLANGVKCSECDESLVDQVLIQSLPHDFIDGVCSICNVSEYCEGLEYKVLEDGTLGVSGIGTCTDENIIIPSFHLGYPVTTICTNAFYEIKNLLKGATND